MPRSRFVPQARRAKSGLEGVLQLYDSFGASLTSTCIQYVRAVRLPCAMIKWSPYGFEWRFISSAAWTIGFRSTLDKMEELPRDSATAQAVEETIDSNKNFMQAVGTTAFWFKNVSPGCDRDLLLFEEAIRLGRYGIITLLYPHSSSKDAFDALEVKSRLMLS